ncbi:alpha/beta fold hydrolase [Plastorhodobacter daqingensis]|uniref:Alpha/beta fold hydrolase n=1 Tax=Plastorhodobacter daqingensis TaxID=1387281 RepID=A0ABW2UJ12_9RHOB
MAANLLALSAVALLLAGCAGLVGQRAAQREARAEATYPPTGRLLDVNGVQVHAHVEGSGPDLVLLHGASGNTRDFTFGLVDRLKSDYRVIAFDRPGLGWTETIGDDTANPIAQADLLRAAADQLGVRNPIVMGHSYGGAVAMAWALRDPDGPSALVIVSGATYPWPGEFGWWYPFISSRFGENVVVPLVTAFAPHRFAERVVIKGIFNPQDVPPGYADYIGVGLSARRESFVANTRQIGKLKPYLQYMAPHYPELTQPIEVLHGNRDRIVGLELHSLAMVSQVPGASLTVLDGIGHMPHHAAPDEVVAAIHRAAERAGLRKAQLVPAAHGEGP